MSEEKKVTELPVAQKRPEKKPKKQEAKHKLRAVVDMVYKQAWEAKEKGEPVGWSSSKFPMELAETFDLKVVYPENQAAGISAKKGGERLCKHAEEMGYDNDICGYERISLAYAAGAVADEKPMPQPDFMLCCNNICNTMTVWYENIARMHNIPLVMIDVPFNNTVETTQEQVDYMKAQFWDAIEQLEKISGKKFDQKKFDEACKNANRSAQGWLKVCSYLQYKPSPMAGFDMFNHMADIVTARCKPETGAAFEELAAELEEQVKDGTSTWSYDENYRIMFEGIPCWPVLRTLFEPLKARGMNTVAVVYGPAFGFVYNNMDEMARAYCKAPNSVCLETGVKWREDLCRENKVDGILVHYNRSCKPWSGYMPEMERRWRKELGIPVVSFDGDQADPRNFSEEQYRTRVDGLFEIMEEERMKKEAAKDGAN